MAINTKSSGEFSIDFNVEDVSDTEALVGESSVGPGPSQSQATSARIAQRLCRKAARETLQGTQDGLDSDADGDD